MVQIDFLSNKLFLVQKPFLWFKNSFFGPKTFHGQKDIFCNKIFSIHLVQKEFEPQKKFGQRNFWLKKEVWSKKIGLNNIFVQMKFLDKNCQNLTLTPIQCNLVKIRHISHIPWPSKLYLTQLSQLTKKIATI